MSWTSNEPPKATKLQDWCDGIMDIGTFDNLQTGLIGKHQVHITVTNKDADELVGWHISVYQYGGDGYVVSDYKPENAIAKYYVYPAGVGKARESRVLTPPRLRRRD